MTHPTQPSQRAIDNVSPPEALKKEASEFKDDIFAIVFDAMNSSLAGIIITDLNGLIRYANPAFSRMFDYVPGTIIGKDSADLFSAREITKLTDVLSIIDSNRNITEEFVVEKSNGDVFVVEASVSIVTSSIGENVGRMASFIDITKRKLLETKLEEKLEKALDHIKVLSGILPICASCKKIRDKEGRWHQFEEYIEAHSEADFTHGICSDCAQKLYPEIKKKVPKS